MAGAYLRSMHHSNMRTYACIRINVACIMFVCMYVCMYGWMDGWMDTCKVCLQRILVAMDILCVKL